MDNNSAIIVSDCCDTTNYYSSNGKLMWISLLSVVAVCILIPSFHSYVRWLQQQRRNGDDYLTRHQPNPNPRPNYLVFNFRPTIAASAPASAAGTTASSPHRRGLERVVLKTLPTFFYNSVFHPSPLECSVCLAEFGDNDLSLFYPSATTAFTSIALTCGSILTPIVRSVEPRLNPLKIRSQQIIRLLSWLFRRPVQVLGRVQGMVAACRRFRRQRKRL
ncbi:hypothetical protein TEA_026725 [Camellia sinensis var. sinensis]|uniref:RING-type domain-containing protein n=1 Tax=Camellia sinensis var. sinensis TaxID=542762 RepID=A0A4S4CVJ5_CAMSN|nr:hypothetical protein TEA_026725 [Camellia sinensis var. sinensis]